MKKIIIALLAVTSLSSCEKFLDQKPISSLTENTFYRNTDEVETGVIACYDGLQKVYDAEYQLTEIRADNTSGYSLEGDWGAIKFFRESPANFFLLDFWQRSYNTIARCNLVLKYLDNVTDPAKKTSFEGEVKFIRSLMYFNLVRLYGEVPLITHSIAFDDNESFVKTTKDAIYTQIKTDLSTAVTNLANNASATVPSARANKQAAQALLAKVYITLKDWGNAKPLLEAIVGPNLKGVAPYGLNPSYAAIFSTATEMSKEIIFAVRYKASSSNEGNSFSYEYSNSGNARNVKASAEYQAMFEAGDVRKAVTFVTTGANIGLAAKFIDAGAPQRDAGNDFPVIRFADALLMYAEVLNELAAVPTATTLAPLNEVRARAGVGIYTIATVTSKEQARDLIYKERQLEFGFENQRWYDLQRMDQAKAINILNTYLAATGNSITVKPFQFVYPLPQTEINLSKGKLEQNPDYK